MKPESYKERINRFLSYIIGAHGGQMSVGDEVISERFLAIDTGLSRTSIREVFAILQYHGFISCEWGKPKKVLRDLEEWDNVKV